jgi:hypothetical protein
MNKQFAELQVYQLGGGIAFGLPGTTTPFLALPSGQATIKPWGTSGFLFENILTGDVIAFVAEYDDVLDSADAPYGVDQSAVFTALAAFFFDLGGGGASDLAGVLVTGNTSGSNDIWFDSFYGLYFSNASRLREGTIDAGLGGNRGIAEICGAGFESKWEAGRRYIMGSSGDTIRQSLYNFNVTPTVTDDDTLGYQIGSLWTLDNGTVYECSDATTGAAIWSLQQNAVPTLDQILGSGNTANNKSIIDLDYLDFETTLGHSVGVGELAWNDTDGTLDLGLKGGLKNKVGQQLVVRARNTSGSTISKGSVVLVVGVAGGFVGINLAQADSVANSATAFGIVAEDIADASNGFVTINGIIHGVNTNAFNEGDILYLSPTTPGAITNNKPESPNYIVVIGYCAKKSAVDGHILLHVQNDTRQAVEIQLAASDETTALTTGTAKVTFRMPHAMTLTSVRASLTTAQASGSIFTVDINQGGSSVLGTKLTIDNTEKTSTTAATAATITTSALTDDAEITIDIDQVGNGTATGLKITLIGTR